MPIQGNKQNYFHESNKGKVMKEMLFIGCHVTDNKIKINLNITEGS
jgi:hypothetical protein